MEMTYLNVKPASTIHSVFFHGDYIRSVEA